MQELFKRYLDRDISRRTLLQGLSAVGLSTVAASAIAESLAPVSVSAAEAAGAVRTVRDTGGTLFIQQLKAAGVKYYFFNPNRMVYLGAPLTPDQTKTVLQYLNTNFGA